MQTIRPEYLHCNENGSDKWYVVAILDEAQDVALTGHGPNSRGATGTWNKVGVGRARNALREKKRKGYTWTQPQHLKPDIAPHLRAKAQEMLRALGGSYAGLNVHANPDGTLQVVMAQAAAPANKPKRRGSRHHVWI